MSGRHRARTSLDDASAGGGLAGRNLVYLGALAGAALLVVAAVVVVVTTGGSSSGTAPPRASGPPPAASPADLLRTRVAPPDSPVAKALTAYLRKEASAGRFAGSAIVVRRGEVLTRFAAGKADEKRANHPESVYRIASVSKQFIAMVILRLEERRKLSTNDQVCKFLETCPSAWRSITLRQLLTHTSGVPDISEFPDFFERLDEPTTARGLISRFEKKKLDFSPGQRWKYSNSGYILAGAAIEKVTGSSLEKALNDEIFGPLRLASSGYDPEQPPPGYAKGYTKPGKPDTVFEGSQAYAAGGIHSTVDDLARWDRALGAGLAAARTTVKKSLTSQVKCPSDGCLGESSTGYAYGWLTGSLDGHRFVAHPGLLGGYHTYNGYYPDDDLAVVVLSNVQPTDVNGIGRRLAQIALG